MDLAAIKITNLEAFVVAMPLVGVFTSGGKSKNVAKGVVVRLTAADGSVGISSVDPSSRAVFPDRAEDLLITITDRLKPLVIGMSAAQVNAISQIMGQVSDSQQGARAAVEIACIDLTCRHLGISLSDYLGGIVTPSVDFNGWVGELPADEATAEARRWVKAGFKSMKIKVGSDLTADIERVLAIRDAVGHGIGLRIDANEQYQVKDALLLCDAVKSADLQLFEQPVPHDDLDGLATIRRKGGIAIMADESISDHASLLRVIEADCADYVKFGVAQAGGLMSAARMIATAEAAGLKVVMGHGFGLDMSTMTEIMVGAAFANIMPGLECVGPLKVTDTVATTKLDISTGSFMLPAVTGLGITLDPDKMARYGVADSEA